MASIEYVVNAVDNASGTFRRIAVSTDDLKRQLDDLSRKVATPSIDVNDKQAQLKIADAAVKLNRLSDKIADPKVEVDTARAERDILKIDAMLTALGKKDEKISVDIAKRGGILGKIGSLAHFRTQGGDLISGLLSGGGSAAGGGAAAAGSAGGGIPGGIGIGALGALGALLGPALIPYGLGLGAGGAGAYLAGGKTISKDFSETIAAIKADVAPLRPLFNSVFESLPNLVKQIGPGLRNVFAESVPFLKSFVGFLGQAAKILLPSFAEVLQKMIPYLPTITKGLLAIVKGFAGFLNALGPNGMKAAAEIFVAMAKLIEGALILIGKFIDWLGPKIVQRVEDWRRTFDDFRHRTAVIFDGIRHDIAHYWDMIWNNTIGRLQRGLQDWKQLTDGWWHDIAHWYDTARHDIASWWDDVWNYISTRAKQGWHDDIAQLDMWRHDIAARFDGIRHDIASWWDDVWNFLKSLPGKFLQIGKEAIQGLWNGMKSVSTGLMGWFKNLIEGNNSFGLIGIAKQLLGIHSPSAVFYDIGRNMMLGLAKGVEANVSHAMSAVRGAMGVLHGGVPAAGDVSGVAALGKAMAAQRGWTGTLWDALNAVEMREAGWNLRAQNPTSGAYGIAQFINGPSEYYQYGGNPNTAQGQITAWLNYVAQRYHNPIAAWQHEQAFGWYGSGLTGGIFNRPTIIGVGERGPERVDVTPLGSSRGAPVSVALTNSGNVIIADRTDMTLVQRKLSYAITASGLG